MMLKKHSKNKQIFPKNLGFITTKVENYLFQLSGIKMHSEK